MDNDSPTSRVERTFWTVWLNALSPARWTDALKKFYSSQRYWMVQGQGSMQACQDLPHQTQKTSLCVWRHCRVETGKGLTQTVTVRLEGHYCYYISGAVNRFFSPEPTNIVRNAPNSFQESAVDSEPANYGQAEGETSRSEVDEEQPLATVSVLSSSRSVVAWEHCITDIDLLPDEESMPYKTRLSRGGESKVSDEGEGTREEQFAQTGNDDARLLLAEDAAEDGRQEEEEENENRKLYSPERDETQEDVEHEKLVNTMSLRLTGDAMSEDMEESRRKASAAEETERAMTPDDHQKMMIMTKIQVKEEEDDKMHDEDEQDLEPEDIEVKLCTITYLSPEEEDDVYIEEGRVQRDEADTAVTHEEVEDSVGVLQLASENENKSDEGPKQHFKGDPSFTSRHNVELQMVDDKSSILSEDELLVVGQEHVMAHRSESDKVEDAKEKEDERTLNERKQSAVIEEENVDEAANNQTIDEAPEQKDDIRSVTADGEEEDISIGHVTYSEEVMQTVEFTAGQQENVAKDTKVQTKTRETDYVETESHGVVINVIKSDMTTTNISVDERFDDKDQVEEERLPSEEGNKESYMGVACTTTSVTVKTEGETGQEIRSEFKNISLGTCEGQIVVPQELNSPTREETQEGVPEYNNEPGPDENTIQRFLEVGDGKEIKTMQLPEEVESKEPESLQNAGCSSGADYSLVREHMGEEQKSTEDIKNSFDLVVEEHAGILHLTDAGLPQETETSLVKPETQESGLLSEEEEGKLLVDSMKTGIEHSEKEFEMHVGLTDESDKESKELRDETEELLFEFETDEGLCDFNEADAAEVGREKTRVGAAEDDETSKFTEAEVQKITETSCFQESVDAINSGQNSNRTLSLLEDFAESGFLKHSVETEPKVLEDGTVEMQNAFIDMEDTGYGVEEKAAEGEVQNKNEMDISNLQVAEMAAEVTTERNEIEHPLITESESLETQNQLSDEALEISNEETEAADESMSSESKTEDLIVISAEEMAKHVTESEGSYAEEAGSPISGPQDVIDEEILDLWIETALSEDTYDIKKQEGPEPGQQMDTEKEPLNEEQDEIPSVQTEKDKEQLVESNSGEFELGSDTDMTSSTAESGFMDQRSTGSFQGIYDMLANMSESAEISELSTPQPNSASQDTLVEEAAETGQSYPKEEESVIETGFHSDSGVTSSVARYLDQESEKSQEKTDEEETGSQKEIDAEVTDLARETECKDAEEAGVESLTEMSTLFKVEETKVEDESVSDSPDEIDYTDSGQSGSGSEASLEEGIVSTGSGSQGDTCTVSEKLLKLPSLDKPQPRWSENIVDTLPGLNRAEVAQQSTAESEDQMEVDTSVLDFTAQRSRIAVKNPRIRPPKDPRSLLHIPSLDPTPSSHLPIKVPAGVPLGGLGIGIKLPGLGAGFPVLKKTKQAVKDENSQETLSQEPETKPEEKDNTPKQDVAQHKPKWMPPRHPGFGNPLMSELKTKLKKPSKE